MEVTVTARITFPLFLRVYSSDSYCAFSAHNLTERGVDWHYGLIRAVDATCIVLNPG